MAGMLVIPLGGIVAAAACIIADVSHCIDGLNIPNRCSAGARAAMSLFGKSQFSRGAAATAKAEPEPQMNPGSGSGAD
jgi:hypothetical protein